MNHEYDYRKPSTIETLPADIKASKKINNDEKRFIIERLEKYLTHLPDANAEFRLSDLVVSVMQESSLQLSQRAGQSKLNDMLHCEEFLNLEELSSIPDTATYVCDEQKRVQVFIDDTSIYIDDLLIENEILNQYLEKVCSYARQAGGFIHSADEINIEQWFNFYGHPMPTTAQHLANYLSYLKKELPELKSTGNYGVLLADPAVHAMALSTSQRAQIQTMTNTLEMRGAGQLLDRLFGQIISAPVEQLRYSPLQYVDMLTTSTIGKIWSQGYLRTLDWYGTKAGESPSQSDLQQLLMTAILLNLDSKAGLAASSTSVLGYELYKPGNANLHPTQILLDLESHLVAQHIISANAAPLAAYILVADVAPELLVQKIPDELTVDSPAWVAHSLTVAKIESIAPGSSRAMTYQQVETYADLAPFDHQLEQLFGLSVIAPLLNWAAMNGLIHYSPTGEYTTAQFSKAETLYTEYTVALDQCSTAISTPLPLRSDIALSELQRAMPGADYLTHKAYHHRDAPLGKPISIHDLFMSGDLISGGWTGRLISNKIGSSFEKYRLDDTKPYLHKLQNIKELYETAFDDYFAELKRGMATTLKLALCTLPEIDRIRLEYGVLSFYTVRRKFPDNASKETQRLRDKYRGRYGVIIRAEFKSRRYYYELLTLRAECHPRPELKAYFEKTAIEYFEPTDSTYKNEEQWQTQAMEWPLDINAYLKGTDPVKSIYDVLVVEKLWQSYEAERNPPTTRSKLETFFSESIQATIDKVTLHFPPATRDELFAAGYGVAPLEAARKNLEDNIDLVLNLVIPFKSCIEDLTSGDPDRRASGAAGCALDALAVVGSVVGVASKFASVALKSGSMLSKSLNVARVSCSFAVSLVNPLDGVPSLLKKGGKLTKNGALLFTRQGVQASSEATRKIRSVSGSLDAIHAAQSLDCVDVKLARVEGISELSQATDMFIFKRANDWYQLELMPNQARGGKLTNFKELKRGGVVELE